MKDTKNMPVKVCRECGSVNSVLKERCENCSSELSEPVKKKIAVLESEIIRLENHVAERTASKNNLSKEEMNLLNSTLYPLRRGVALNLSTAKRREKHRLGRLQRRLSRIKAKEEKASAKKA